MAYPFNPADDFVLFDGIETVTYRPRVPSEAFDTTADVESLWHRPDFVEPEFSGETVAIVHIRADKLGDIAKPRDELTRDSDGSNWVVVDAKLRSFESRYELFVKKMRVTTAAVTLLVDSDDSQLTDETGQLLVASN